MSSPMGYYSIILKNSQNNKVKRIENLFNEDKMANYPYKRCHKQYCVIIVD
jgi:hypothetical protein